MWIVDISIRRAVFAVMMIGSLVVLGIIGAGRLGVDLFPEVQFPFVSITTTLEGTSPETMETEVTDVIEENVNTISGLKQLRSTSAEGLSQVFVEFELNENIDVKAQDVRDKVALARRDLPIDVDPPIVEKIDPDAAPILSVMIAGDMPIRDLTTFADEVAKEALERLPGVGSVTLVGGRLRQIRVWLDAFNLRSFGVTADDVVNAIRSEHAELPGGRMEVDFGERELGAKTVAEARTVEEIGNLVVAFRPNGAATRIRDVARIEDGLEDERTFAQLNGVPGVSLEVRRQSGKNTVEVATAIKAEVEKLRELAPEGVRIVVARDVSRFIESSISEVTKELQIAIVLVVLITFFFLLSWRSTLIVATAIPASLIATFFILDLFDFTINTLTLLAMTVAIGLLVDDAIVVVEAIQRDVDEGEDRIVAASVATKRVGLAVLAGTFATLAVFVPIAFMEGIVGRFFLQYGLTIVFSVSVSLLVALTLSPMLSSRFLKKAHATTGVLGKIEKFHQRVEARYGAVVHRAMRWRYPVVAAAFASVLIGGWFASQVPSDFTSKADRSEFLGTVELPLGVGVEGSKAVAAKIERALSEIQHINDVFLTVGSGSQQKANQIDLYVSLTPKQKRDISQFLIMDKAREAIRKTVPEARKITVGEVPWVSGAGTSADIEFVVRGSDIEAIREYVDRLTDLMRSDPHFSDVQSSYESGRPEVQFTIDRLRAADLGVSARTLASTMRTIVGGVNAGTFQEGGRRYDIRVRLEESQRQNVDQLSLVQLRGSGGRLIDLTNAASIEITAGPAQIDRQDRARRISIFANAGTGYALGEATERLRQFIAENPVPRGMTTSFEGQARRMAESAQAIGFAFMLAIVALYIVLASQFNSFVQPLVIMVTAPLSFSGAFAGLYFTGQEMSIFAQIGIIALMGIVMKNGILLVDRANQLIEEGRSPMEAMLEAGPERLRPVLMTALAAVFGMIPVAISGADGSEWRNAMGVLIIGGLSSSTFLTLLVIPAVFLIPNDIQRLYGKVRSRIGIRKANWLGD